MLRWIHQLMNPHCEECKADKICISCETLREQLSIANYERSQLVNQIIRLTTPATETKSEIEQEFKPIKPKPIPWNVKRQMLEEEDRKLAQVIKSKDEEIKIAKTMTTEELEKELGIATVAESAS